MAMNSCSSAIARLPHVRLLCVTGPDATDFLQAQLSTRVDNLAPQCSALAGWHDARGRVRAVFRILRITDGYLLETPADLAEQLCQAMRMFVLRADVRVELTDLVCAGIAATAGQTSPAGAATPAAADLILPDTPGDVAVAGPVSAVCVAPGCWHFIAPADVLTGLDDADSGPTVAAEIRAGIPQVDSRTTLQFVPHMLNLDRLGAIDFEKGCYPGQEVIARTQHLGSVKRRARAFSLDLPAQAATVPESDTPIVDSGGERIGEVLRAARDADGSVVLLAVVTLASLDGDVRLGAAEGPVLVRIGLPYE
jgi:folate-binding protein YgfZ